LAKELISSLRPTFVLELGVMMAVRSMAPVVLLMLLGCFPSLVAATGCPDDPELDLCDADNASNTHIVSSAPSRKVVAHHIAFPLALALHFGGAKHGVWVPLLVPLMSLASWAPTATAMISGGPEVNNMLDGWTVVNPTDSVMYPGSTTTGQSHDNEVCSPYAIASFDNLCKQIEEK